MMLIRQLNDQILMRCYITLPTQAYGQLWKSRPVMEKTDSYGKDGHLWKRRAGIAVNSTIVSATFFIIKRQSKIIYEPMSSITHYHSINDQ